MVVKERLILFFCLLIKWLSPVSVSKTEILMLLSYLFYIKKKMIKKHKKIINNIVAFGGYILALLFFY